MGGVLKLGRCNTAHVVPYTSNKLTLLRWNGPNKLPAKPLGLFGITMDQRAPSVTITRVNVGRTR